VRFYTIDIVELARKDRLKGLTAREISKKLGVPDTTISRWIRDIPFDNWQFKRAKQAVRLEKSRYADINFSIFDNENNARVLASLLYWCEGSKYPASSYVGFANSDPNLVRFFLYLLRRGFCLDEEKLNVNLQLHTTQDEAELKLFWSTLLSIDESRFYKSTITDPTRKRKRRNYMGTCTVKYHDVKLLHQITGIWESLIARNYGGVAERPNAEDC